MGVHAFGVRKSSAGGISVWACSSSSATDTDNTPTADGGCELIVGNESQSAVFSWSEADQRWKQLGYKLPEGAMIVDEQGRDAGLRFVDLNEDGYPDIIFSNERRYSIHLFRPAPDPRLN